MPIKIKTQKDYLSTKVALDPAGTDLTDLDSLMKTSKSTGRIVAVYSQGGLMNLDVEQNSHIKEKFSEQIRGIIDVATREIE